ncbi:5-bromo-4-chloroindolyl phosphate hydrolysis family protein [Aliiroseovarius subalbicans]|uniref:5-bromo-4-chloroindolyl phosphate hydrolysis family protein n=1 Tax=Aliiroseovarius subalbicans TaxID=2925840 RepID=UPI001F57853B|nr:5-bromo-4-chloroindolyl phosphate hydrolysis family protein [Aliiroseovarius subalbicans]MCI2399335.1 5-bromo-4-chloroindolyl phosphate hydrolysis family protein [Aliiroseovarius subalbicans]
MAQRYGGEHSPDGAPKGGSQPPKNPFDGKTRTRAGGRVNFLFLAPLPLVFRAFFRDPTGLALSLVAFAILMLAAWLTREGVLAQEAYDARKIARRPAIPRKIFGSILTGAGLFVAGYVGGSLVNSIIFALLGIVLHFTAFGPDPLRDKGMEGIDTFQTDRVARAVGEAEKHLAAMKDAILRARDRGLERRVESFQTTARDMFRTIEDDPRDLTAARKYLGVYLLGARDATAKFADLYARTRDDAARADYERLLDDLEANFTARTQQLLTDNRSDLDVEIEVLRERLAREGVRMDQT